MKKTSSTLKSRLASVLKYLFLLVVAAGLFLLAFRGVDISRIFLNALHANMIWVAVSALFSIAAFVSRAYRWNLLIESTGYSSPLNTTTYSLMVGYFANLAFPRLGEVTRCGVLRKASSVPFNVSLGTVIVERTVDVISLLLCLLLAFVFEFRRLGNLLLDDIVNPVLRKVNRLTSSPLVLAGLVVLLTIVIFTFRLLNSKKAKSASESTLAGFIKGLINGVKSIGKLRRPWLFVFHSVFIWVLYFLSMYVCFFAFPFTTSLGLSAALFLLVAGSFAMSAPVQGGIGVYHLLVSQGLLLYGLTQEQGLVFATLIHGISLLLVVILGSASLLLLFTQKKKSQEISKEAYSAPNKVG